MIYLLQQLLTLSADRYPNKEAVVYKKDKMTFQYLERISNQLAYILRECGVNRGDRVGIYLNKSIESVVAIFAILKAGAAYVPLDPSVPIKRVSYIIDDCGMKVLIGTHKKIANLGHVLPHSSSIQYLIITEEGVPLGKDDLPSAKVVFWNEVLKFPLNSPLDVLSIEEDLAYILYTSGSTGEPKGVMISHKASLSFVNWAYGCFQVQATDRVSNQAPLHFDLSIFDIFTTIKAGATVILVPEELSVFPVNLANFIEEQKVTIWYSVPSVLTQLVLYGNLERHQFSHLNKILFAGEMLPVKYLRQLKNLIPLAEYYNLYGPTETNVCTFYQVKDIPSDRVEPFPIGRACANSEVFAVNDRNEIAARGEVGELYVRGPSLMKGYWGMLEKSRDVLVPHPAHPWEEKVYRTGDLVKQDQDGNYLFLGRRDNMIKSRGYRIELGEIETVLYRHPGVEETAVIAIPDEEIGNVIKAVVVTRDAGEVAKRELESFCSEHIPKYMIPGIIEIRASLPKTSTGKLDKTFLLKEHIENHSR